MKWLLLIYNHVRNELIMKRMNQFLLWTALILLSFSATGCSSKTEGGLDLSEVKLKVSSNEIVEEKSFGERQLEQLMSDRPDMQGVVPTDHVLYRWVVRSFEKERTGSRIYWVADQPSSGEKAEHAPSYFGYPAYICITNGLDASPIDKWTMLVFEMFNIENAESIRLLTELGLAGEIDGDTYARKCVEQEFKAAVKTRNLFRETPLPNPQETRDVFYYWVVSEDTPFHDHKKLWDSDAVYLKDSNYRHFKKHYDEWIAPYVSPKGTESP